MKNSRMLRRTGTRAAALSLAVGGLAAALVPQPAVADTETDAARRVDHVIYWNKVLLNAFRETGGTPGPISRGGAITDIAIYDAVNSIRPIGKPYLTSVPEARGVNGALESAIDQAAYTALKGAFPKLDFEDELKAAVAQQVGGTAHEKELGRSVGTTTANAILAARAGDGSDDTTPYTVVNQPGHWRPTPGSSATPGTPNWGKVKPFALTSGAQFRPAGILGHTDAKAFLATDAYAKGVEEVRRLGGKNSTERTAEQTQIARYWANDLNGTYKPVGQQYDHTIAVYQARQSTVDSTRSAKLFALVSISLADAAIAVWDSKFDSDWDLWRPESAVNLADTDGNDTTVADPDWRPLSSDVAGNSFSPAFPSYVSGHSGIVAAWAGAMKHFYGRDDIAFTGGTDDPQAVGVKRSFKSFSQAAQEKADSRIYAGVHFRWDNDAALDLGYHVADHVYANTLR